MVTLVEGRGRGFSDDDERDLRKRKSGDQIGLRFGHRFGHLAARDPGGHDDAPLHLCPDLTFLRPAQRML